MRTDTPVLVLTNRFDPSTPATSAFHPHRLLPNSRLLVNEGWGHVTTQQSRCMVDAASAYLATGTLPRPGPARPGPARPGAARRVLPFRSDTVRVTASFLASAHVGGAVRAEVKYS